MTLPRSAPRLVAAAILVAGLVVTVVVNFPGHLEFDSIRQLLEGRSRVYSNWHPPIMSWLLGVADSIEPGAAPFFIFDACLAFGSLISLLWLTPRISWVAAIAAALIVESPQLFLFQAIVWKDILFADACLAGFVCLASAAANWSRLSWRLSLLGASLVFLTLAILTRQSALVILPCAVIALGFIAARESSWRAGLIYPLGFFLACGALTLSTNAALQLRASKALGPIEQIEDLQLYDMAGMLKHEPALKLPILERDAPEMAKRLYENGALLYTPIQHDRLTDDPVIHGLIIRSVTAVSRQWRSLVLANPGNYLAVRAEDFSWLFFSLHPDECLVYEVGVSGDPADLVKSHLPQRYDARDEWLDEQYATPLVTTPVLSHPAFAFAGLLSLVVLLLRRRPVDIAIAGLLVASLVYTLSFFFISIACQYRYLFVIDLSVIAALFYLATDLSWWHAAIAWSARASTFLRSRP